MSKLAILQELGKFLISRGKWWLLPIIAVFVLLGLLIVFTESSAVAPFIYAIF